MPAKRQVFTAAFLRGLADFALHGHARAGLQAGDALRITVRPARSGHTRITLESVAADGITAPLREFLVQKTPPVLSRQALTADADD